MCPTSAFLPSQSLCQFFLNRAFQGSLVPKVAFSVCPGPSPPVHSQHRAPCPWLLFQTSLSWVPQTVSLAPLRALSPHCCVILHSFSKGWPFPSLTRLRCPQLLCVCQFLPLELAAPFFFSWTHSTLVSTFCSSKHSLHVFQLYHSFPFGAEAWRLCHHLFAFLPRTPRTSTVMPSNLLPGWSVPDGP